MDRFIMPWKVMIVLLVVAVIFCFFQCILAESFKEHEKVWEGVPTFAGWTENKGKVEMKVICDGKEAVVSDSKLIVSYLENTSVPLPEATLYDNGEVKAKPVK